MNIRDNFYISLGVVTYSKLKKIYCEDEKAIASPFPIITGELEDGTTYFILDEDKISEENIPFLIQSKILIPKHTTFNRK